MNPGPIVALRRDRWERLGILLERVQAAGLPALAPGEVREFARLYRETAADLARLRTAGVDPETEQYVERLVAGGHNALYRDGGEGIGAGGLARFLLRGFPALVRRSGAAIAMAAGVWLLGALLAYAVAVLRPDLARDLCPQRFLDRAEAAEGARIRGEAASYVDMEPAFTPLWSSQLIANNVQATFVVFALGMTAGVGTVALLFLNGILFGAVAGVFSSEGVASSGPASRPTGPWRSRRSSSPGRRGCGWGAPSCGPGRGPGETPSSTRPWTRGGSSGGRRCCWSGRRSSRHSSRPPGSRPRPRWASASARGRRRWPGSCWPAAGRRRPTSPSSRPSGRGRRR